MVTNVTIQYLKTLLKLYSKKKKLHNFQYNVLFTIRYLQLLTGIYFNLFTNFTKGEKEEKRCKHQVRRGEKRLRYLHGLRWLATVSNTFQDLDFDWSL